MKLVIRTQYMENYGAHDWDGEGSCPQRWKYKGGSEYMIEGVPANIDHQAVVEYAGVEKSNDYMREYVLGWTLEADDYQSEFERSQLEYEGQITYPEPRIEYSEIRACQEYEYEQWAGDLDAQYYGA